MKSWRDTNAQKSWFKSLTTTRNQKGVPVAGQGGHHSYRKSHGGGNKIGAINSPNKEWGSKARKEQEHLTGLASRAEADAIAEQLDEKFDPDYEGAPLSNNWLYDLDVTTLPGVSLNGIPLDVEDEFSLVCAELSDAYREIDRLNMELERCGGPKGW